MNSQHIKENIKIKVDFQFSFDQDFCFFFFWCSILHKMQKEVDAFLHDRTKMF